MVKEQKDTPITGPTFNPNHSAAKDMAREWIRGSYYPTTMRNLPPSTLKMIVIGEQAQKGTSIEMCQAIAEEVTKMLPRMTGGGIHFRYRTHQNAASLSPRIPFKDIFGEDTANIKTIIVETLQDYGYHSMAEEVTADIMDRLTGDA